MGQYYLMIKIAIPIRPMIYDEGHTLMAKARKLGADVVEIWCDKLKLEDAKNLVRHKELPIILNLKSPDEGGEFKGTFSERMQYLAAAAAYGADFIDIPFSHEVTEKDIDSIKDKVILSHHDFEVTSPLPDLEQLISSMIKLKPKMIKLATTVNREIDLINLFKLQINYPEYRDARIIIGMGEKGKVTRVMAPMFNQPMTFASLDDNHITAPGQISINELTAQWQGLNLITSS